MSDFKKGDIVYLKSGSPKMTIEYIDGKGRCECIWFDNNKKSKDFFDPDVLTKENPTPPSMPIMG